MHELIRKHKEKYGYFCIMIVDDVKSQRKAIKETLEKDFGLRKDNEYFFVRSVKEACLMYKKLFEIDIPPHMVFISSALNLQTIDDEFKAAEYLNELDDKSFVAIFDTKGKPIDVSLFKASCDGAPDNNYLEFCIDLYTKKYARTNRLESAADIVRDIKKEIAKLKSKIDLSKTDDAKFKQMLSPKVTFGKGKTGGSNIKEVISGKAGIKRHKLSKDNKMKSSKTKKVTHKDSFDVDVMPDKKGGVMDWEGDD